MKRNRQDTTTINNNARKKDIAKLRLEVRAIKARLRALEKKVK